MPRSRRFWQALPLTLAIAGAAPAGDPDVLAALAAADLRVQTVADRLRVAAAPLCDHRALVAGIVVHGTDTYMGRWRAVARRLYGLDGRPAIEGIVTGSPAEAAGLAAGDRLVAVDGRQLAAGSGATRAARMALAAAPPSARVEVERAGKRFARTLAGPPGCRAAVEVTVDARPYAASDRDSVIIPTALTNLASDDDQLAVAIAHELAHLALAHTRRLAAAGVPFDSRRTRGEAMAIWAAVEDEADLLSLNILARAGIDPCSAARYWTQLGPTIVAAGLQAIYRQPADRARFLGLACGAVGALSAPPDFWRRRHASLGR